MCERLIHERREGRVSGGVERAEPSPYAEHLREVQPVLREPRQRVERAGVEPEPMREIECVLRRDFAAREQGRDSADVRDTNRVVFPRLLLRDFDLRLERDRRRLRQAEPDHKLRDLEDVAHLVTPPGSRASAAAAEGRARPSAQPTTTGESRSRPTVSR